MIGITLDKYQVLQKVGEGGTATVYRGRHLALDRDVAIKVLHPHLSSSTRNRTRFAREARATAQLHHDNIIEIFDYSGIEADKCYIVTEFVQGETLTACMQHFRALPSEVTARMGRALCQGLAYAHEAGVLHRDLKPDNIMIRSDGTLKLMDFGIARFLNEAQVTMTGTLVGSPAFMSPEQAKEEPLDTRSDLFSLGTLLYYLVSGRLPFEGSNPSLILKNIIEGNRQPLLEVVPTASATLADTIEQLLAVNRNDRLHSAQQVSEALTLSLTEVGIHPTDDTWSLACWLANPDDYQHRLNAYLPPALLAQGKQALSQSDPLGALRLFNRLLAIDEHHPEVLELVQGLAAAPRAPQSKGYWFAAAALLSAVAASAAWVAATPPTTGQGLSPQGAIPQAIVHPDPLVMGPSEQAPALLLSQPKPPSPVQQPTASKPQPPLRVVLAPPKPPRATPAAPKQAPSPPKPTPAADGFLDVRVARETGGFASVVVDGKETGHSTRSQNALPLAAGPHQVELRSRYFEPQSFDVTITSNQTTYIAEVKLTPKPLTVHFDRTWPPDCVVYLDGVMQHPLGTDNRSLSIQREHPSDTHTVRLQCQKTSHVRRYDQRSGLDAVFAPQTRGTP